MKNRLKERAGTVCEEVEESRRYSTNTRRVSKNMREGKPNEYFNT